MFSSNKNIYKRKGILGATVGEENHINLMKKKRKSLETKTSSGRKRSAQRKRARATQTKNYIIAVIEKLAQI